MIDTKRIEELQQKLNDALQVFAAENGLTASSVSVKYTDTDFRVVSVFAEAEANPFKVDPIFLRDLRKNGVLCGLNQSMVGKQITLPKFGIVSFCGMKGTKAVFQSVSTGALSYHNTSFISVALSNVALSNVK